MAMQNFKGVPDDYAETPYWKKVMNDSMANILDKEFDNIKQAQFPIHKGPPKSKTMADLDSLMKDIYYSGSLFHDQQKYLDPVLIKGEGYKPQTMWQENPTIVAPPYTPSHEFKQVYIKTKVEIPGYSDQQVGFKQHGFAATISNYSDVTESQLRKLLLDGFMKITDDIIKQMKENKK